MGSNAQGYCLRWNNHKTNLLSVFEELLQNEAFTDVTLVCDGGIPIKCHRMVLAACSQYFQNLFTDLPCKHPVVVLKDVRYCDVKAILGYMYRGEVNVGHDQLGDLLQVAEALKVKGLVEEKRGSESGSSDAAMRADSDQPSPTGVSTSSTSNNQSTVHSSSAESPPHSTNGFIGYKNPYHMYQKKAYSAAAAAAESQAAASTRLNIPMWHMPGMPPMPPSGHSPPPHDHISPNASTAPSTAAMLASCYQAGNPDMNPLKRKKQLSSFPMSRDTPILRTVLGQADSSQPVSLVCHSDESPPNVNSNGVEELSSKHIKNEPSEGAQSPFTDISMEYEEKSKMMNPTYTSAISGIATYVPSSAKPEWKRYKQYSRDEIMAAINAVRNGMSALQAARKYGVPSRTLYDKVKKLGITTSRPFKRGANGGNLGFPYGISGTSSPFMESSDEHSINNNSASLLEASSILQHALDVRDDKEALAAMVAAAAHAAISGRNTSPNNNNSTAARPSSPTSGHHHLKYMRLNSLPPSPVVGSDPNHSETNGSGSSSTDRDHDEHDHDDEEPDERDQVEDLSVAGRKQVIMPPINMSSIIQKEEMLKETLMEEMRREVSVDNVE